MIIIILLSLIICSMDQTFLVLICLFFEWRFLNSLEIWKMRSVVHFLSIVLFLLVNRQANRLVIGTDQHLSLIFLGKCRDSHLCLAIFTKIYFLLYLSAVYNGNLFIPWFGFFFNFIHSLTHSLAESSTQSLSHVLAQPLDFLFRLAMAGGSHPLLHGVNIYVAQDCTG